MTRSTRLAVAMVLSLISMSTPSAFAQNSTQQLPGSWVLQFVDDPSQTPVPPVPPHTGLMGFDRDGGAIEFLANVDPPGLRSSDGLGEWARLGENSFAVTMRFAVASFNANGGQDFGFFKQQFRLAYNDARTELAGPYVWSFVTTTGTVLFGGSGTVILRRIGVEP